jgi:hypothetical protein
MHRSNCGLAFSNSDHGMGVCCYLYVLQCSASPPSKEQITGVRMAGLGANIIL